MPETPYDADVVHVTDFRLPGGTTHSVAEEVRAQSEAGYRTHLVHAPSHLVGKAAGWSSNILEVSKLPGVSVSSERAHIRAKIVVFRHPSVVEQTPSTFRNIVADKVLVVANNPAANSAGKHWYTVSTVTRKLRALFGTEPIWAPIGPVVKQSIVEQGAEVHWTTDYWLNLLRLPRVHVPRQGFVDEVPVIGRHSRPQPAKWPANRDAILAAYPDSAAFKVEILGGAPAARSVLGGLPNSWSVVPFGGEEPTEFLKRIDFWVYFHHPEWREAYGRAIMEALSAGTVVILPRYLESTYGEAALYCEPAEVQQLVLDYYDDTEKFLKQSRRAQEFIKKLEPSIHEERLREMGISPGGPRPSATKAEPLSVCRTRRRVLFLTSNGAGMGHLTRLLSVATRLPEHAEPVFASLSTGVHIVGDYDIPYEYIGSSGAMGMEPKVWNRYSEQRFNLLLEDLEPDVLVFDGTWPYPGLRRAMSRHTMRKVWMRRAMWKPETTPKSLGWSAEFDLILEPGEFAHTYDAGPTIHRSEAVPIAPITLLSGDGVLSRGEARRQLGYDDEEKIVLVTLGAGNINDIGALQETLLEWFSAKAPDWRLVLTKPPIAQADGLHGVDTLQVYPLARYTRAFDFAVSATGYNAFHEWMVGGLPTIWVPNTATKTDDQLARARWAADAEMGFCVTEEQTEELEIALNAMTDHDTRTAMRDRLSDLNRTNGAVEAANLIGGEIV